MRAFEAAPAAGAVVMGTGIVSIGLAVDGAAPLSLALLAVAAAVWALLVGGLATVVRRARSPGALTAVAGTDVLAARVQMLGWNREAAVLLVLALCLWALLVPAVLAGWERPAVGVSFLLTVATESLAVVGAALAHAYDAGWLALASLALVGVGLAFYVFVVAAFEPRQLRIGRGDQWVSGGALAIATLACARLAMTAPSVGVLRHAHHVLMGLSLALWVTAIAWLPVLVACDLAGPRSWSDVRRWSTVFPVGMYAACSFAVARATGVAAVGDFARSWIWVAVVVWALVAVALGVDWFRCRCGGNVRTRS